MKDKNIVDVLRIVAFIEGISYVVLLAIAMPLKYAAGMPQAVRITGSVHGALFVLFCLLLLQAFLSARWKFSFAANVFASAVIPLGTFFMDKTLGQRADEVRAEAKAKKEAA